MMKILRPRCGGSLSIAVISLARRMCTSIFYDLSSMYVGVVVKNMLAYFSCTCLLFCSYLRVVVQNVSMNVNLLQCSVYSPHSVQQHLFEFHSARPESPRRFYNCRTVMTSVE